MNETMTTFDEMVTTLNTTAVSAEDEKAAFYYNLAEKLFIAVDPIITFGGLIGNILMFCIMMRKDQKKNGVSTFLATLAITDSTVLILDFVNNWLKMEPKIYLLGMSEDFCKFHRFFFNVAYTYAAWLIVGVSVERFIAVWFPFKAREVCTTKNAIITVILMFVPIFFYYLYNIWAWEIDAEGNCNTVASWENFQNNYGPWMSGFFYSYIPIIALIVINSAIIYKLTVSRKQFSKTSTSKSDDKLSRQVTVSVVTICLAYLLLTLPLALFYIILFAADQFVYQGPEMAVAEVVILIFGLSNHSVNFFLYVFASQKFRCELLAMFGRKQMTSKYKDLGSSEAKKAISTSKSESKLSESKETMSTSNSKESDMGVTSEEVSPQV